MTTQLAALLAGARDAIDGARASDEEFARFVAHHAESGAHPAAEHAADLGLAFACGAPGAIEALDRLLTAKERLARGLPIGRGAARAEESESGEGRRGEPRARVPMG